jgi:hypothetical protein
MKYYLYSVCKVTNYILNDWHFTTKKMQKAIGISDFYASKTNDESENDI